MANPEHLKILKQGVEVWNKWREENPEVKPDLSEEVIVGLNLKLTGINFRQINVDRTRFIAADLSAADFSNSHLSETSFNATNLSNTVFEDSVLMNVHCWSNNLRYVIFRKSAVLASSFIDSDLEYSVFDGVDFNQTDFRKAKLNKSSLCGKFRGMNFSQASFQDAIIQDCDFSKSIFIETDLRSTQIDGCVVYGISAWDIKKDGLIQKDLIITPPNEPEITVDDLEVAQFIYLILNNEKIKHVIEEITSKAVLILGRFGIPERKAVLDAIKDKLRKHEGKYLPIVFDFEGPVNQKVKDTVLLLARMSKFIIVDVSDPSCAPYEIGIIEQSNIKVPIQPIIQKPQKEFAMLPTDSPFLPIYRYDTQESLLENIASAIIAPAEQKVAELRGK